jgi:hypothetical protein
VRRAPWALAVLACACASRPAPPRVVPTERVLVAAAHEVPDAVFDAGAVDPPGPPAPLACITRYYGGVARRDGGRWSLVLPDGESVAYDDGRAKTLDERFESPDVKDIYELRYPTGPVRPITEIDFDPGRIRIDAIFFDVYGRSAKEVQAALVPVKLGGKTFLVHRKIAEPLRRVAARIRRAMKLDPKLARFFQSPGGTFNWRRIAGGDQLSMHSWAIAIDLDTKRANYWRNERQDRPLHWKNSYPQAIVDAFEAEGFVWGGRWYHFDTMHFEYRPELLDPSCYPRR